MTEKKGQTYDFICFTDLAYEFAFTEKAEIEKKIKRRLKYHKLAPCSQQRVDYLRQLKIELHAEISSEAKSKYFHKLISRYSDLTDFDIDLMTTDFIKKYDKVDETDMKSFIGFAIYVYHLR